ncbi:MAG: helix-turn-helix domain-containing protein [Muribaculaceae bacterium]
MDQSLYRYSLCLALPLMVFFGFHMLFARVPEKRIFSNFLLSRRLMGTALLLLAANYSVHLFYLVRLKDITATILMNMATYFLCYWLFSSAMMTLLDKRYVTRNRFTHHITMWLCYSAMAGVTSILLPSDSNARICTTIALAVWLMIYGLFLSIRLLRTYSKAIRIFENTHSDDIGAYIRWLSIFTYWAIGFGVGSGLLTFLPDEYVYIWILSAIPFYIYLYCCYQNYILLYEKVENALLEDADLMDSDENALNGTNIDELPIHHSDIARRIEEWVESEGYCKQGITLNDLSQLLCTNRTYLSEYINGKYHMPFRDWISDLRIEHAKRLMTERPQLKIHEISEIAGFLSPSHFSRTFSEKENCSPTRWRKIQSPE